MSGFFWWKQVGNPGVCNPVVLPPSPTSLAYSLIDLLFLSICIDVQTVCVCVLWTLCRLQALELILQNIVSKWNFVPYIVIINRHWLSGHCNWGCANEGNFKMLLFFMYLTLVGIMLAANITVICPYSCLLNFIWWNHASGWKQLHKTHPTMVCGKFSISSWFACINIVFALATCLFLNMLKCITLDLIL